VCIQALDDIMSPMRASTVSKNSVQDFKSAIDFFLSQDEGADEAYEFSFINICKTVNIDYAKLKPLLSSLLPMVEKEVLKKIKGEDNL
jgi:hypothetical protein